MGTIGREFSAQVIGPQRQILASITVALEWTELDPYAVTATFTQDNAPVPWVFARALMRGGMSSLKAVGLGDVAFCRQVPSVGGNLEVRLDSPEGVAVVQLPADEVTAFLRETMEACPFGSESAIIEGTLDAELKELLG